MSKDALHPDFSLHQPMVHWEGETPVATAFDDVYFSKKGGVEEGKYVFLQGNQLPERWNARDVYCIAELGFGTGLNFLLTLELWRQHRKLGQRLNYISYEKYPLSLEQLSKAYQSLAKFGGLSEQLLERYPVLTPGFHRLHFDDDSVTLTLVFLDIGRGLRQTVGTIDCWYLDGFAPSKNPEMWSEEVFSQIARLSAADATLSTFSSAGVVRRGLADAGFLVEKKPGFAAKREMLVARREDACSDSYSSEARDATKRVAVIGGGLSGTSVAFSLARKGCRVTLFEQGETLASGSSGNLAGVIMPHISVKPDARTELSFAGFSYTRHILRLLSAAGLKTQWTESGVYRLTTSRRFSRLEGEVEKYGLPAEFVKVLAKEELSEQLGHSVSDSGFVFPAGGWLSPAALCDALATGAGENLELHLDEKVEKLEVSSTRWKVLSGGGVERFDSVVLCNSFAAAELLPETPVPVTKVRGQLLYSTPKATNSLPEGVLCYDGYSIPCSDSVQVIGSTYDREGESLKGDFESLEVDPLGQKEILRRLFLRAPSLVPEGEEFPEGRVSFRGTTPDRIPIVGEIPTEAAPGSLFVSVGHGSQGLVSTLLSGEIIASQIVSDPLPIGMDVLAAISPQRYLSKK